MKKFTLIIALLAPLMAQAGSVSAQMNVGASVVYKHTATAQNASISCLCGAYVEPVVTQDGNTITFYY